MKRPLVVVPSAEDQTTRRLVTGALGDAAEVAFLAAKDTQREHLLRTADALLVFAWRVAEAEIPLLARCRVVQSVWAGTDRIPVERLVARHPRLVVASGSGPNASQVAEHALALYLDLAKGITWRDRALRAGTWTQDVPGKRVAGSRVAVVGYGAIGRRVARGLLALEARVTAVNRSGRLDAADAAEGLLATTIAGLRQELAAHAGVVLAVPLTEETRDLVDRAFLAAMPADGILVNVARGGLIVREDLLAHLRAQPEFRAGIDTWWSYPKGDGALPADMWPLVALANVVATPHSAFNVPGARADMVRGAVRSLLARLAGPV